MQCTCWMKELWNPFVCDADQHFDMKVKCPPRRAWLLGQFPHCVERNSSQMPGYAWGMGGFGIEWYASFTIVIWKRKCFDFSLIGIMLSMLKPLGNLTAQLWWNDLPWISLFTKNNECRGRWKSAQQKICASTSQLGLYLMNILIFVSSAW